MSEMSKNEQGITMNLSSAREAGFHCVDEAEFQQQCQSCLWWFTEDKIDDGLCGIHCPVDCSHETDEVLFMMITQMLQFDFRQVWKSLPATLTSRLTDIYCNHVFDVKDRQGIYDDYQERIDLGMENKVLKFAQVVEAMQ